MPMVITGNPLATHTDPLSFNAPADGDAGNAASINPPAQALADICALFQSKGARVDLANTFTQQQVLQALLILSNNLQLNAAVAQTILKTAAGGLTVGTAAAAGDLTLSANGVAMLKALASGSLDAQAKVLGNLAAPAAAADAATKGYVDGLTTPPALTALTVSAPWTNGAGNQALRYYKLTGRVYLIGQVQAGAGGGTIATLPAGCRPLTPRNLIAVDTGTNGAKGCYMDNVGNLTMTGPTNGNWYDFAGVSLLAEQ